MFNNPVRQRVLLTLGTAFTRHSLPFGLKPARSPLEATTWPKGSSCLVEGSMRSRAVRRGQATGIRKSDLASEAKIIRRLFQLGKLRAKQAVDIAAEIGQRLAKVKNSPDIPHGKWLSWLQKNFTMSEA